MARLQNFEDSAMSNVNLKMNPLLIVNPIAGTSLNSDLLPELLDVFKSQNLEVDIEETTPDEDGQKLALEAVSKGVELVIVAGGDGTIEAVVRGLANTQTALGIIPLGTRNNLAASLNIPNNFNQAVRILVEGQRSWIDLGKVEEYYFCEVVGVGLEASLFPCGEEVKDAFKTNYFAAIAGIISGFKMFFEFPYHRLTLRLDGKRKYHPQTLQVNICNTPRYGVEFLLAPDATMNDGKLDVIYMNHSSKWDHLRHFFSAMRGQSFEHEKLRTHQATKIQVTSHLPLEVHADGTCIGNTPVTIEVVPKALQVVIPTPELLAEFAAEADNNISKQNNPFSITS
jgi:YegS/Rv2252/BmrU family lipid kinase